MIHDKTTYEIYFYYDDDDDKLWWIQYDDDDSRQVTLNTWHIELNDIDHNGDNINMITIIMITGK